MKQKIKILWYDRNEAIFDFKYSLKNAEHLDFHEFTNLEEAIEALRSDSSFRLVISGNYLGEGIKLFNELDCSEGNKQFLLFSGDMLIDYEPYLLLDNFNYLSKYLFETKSLQMTIETLINKTVQNDDSHLKLALLRACLGYSASQFAAILKIPTHKLLDYELANDIPSSFIVNVCNVFELPLKLFALSSLDQYNSILRTELALKKRTM